MKKLFSVLFFVMLLVVSCSMIKAPAELAIKAAEEALKVVRPEAAQFFPEQLGVIEITLTNAKQAFEKGEYRAALKSAKDLPAQIKDLADAIEVKKAELPQNWTELSAELPKLIASANISVAKSKWGDQAALEEAKSEVALLNTAWTEAQKEFKAGNLFVAVAKAKDIKARAENILNNFGAATATASQ
jgi:hypothetical protein